MSGYEIHLGGVTVRIDPPEGDAFVDVSVRDADTGEPLGRFYMQTEPVQVIKLKGVE